MSRLPNAFLYRMRNEIPMIAVIRRILELPHKEVEGIFRFLCPVCREFNTAINPKANLGRCFRCKRNFNPIDLVIADTRCCFLDAVKLLKPWLQQKCEARS